MSMTLAAWVRDEYTPAGTGQPAGVKLVLLTIATYANSATGQCNPTNATLAKACCMSVRQLQRIKAQLVKSGVLSIVDDNYVIVQAPQIADPAPEPAPEAAPEPAPAKPKRQRQKGYTPDDVTPLQQWTMLRWGAQSYPNKGTYDTLAELEEKHGAEAVQRKLQWALGKNMRLGQAVSAVANMFDRYGQGYKTPSKPDLRDVLLPDGSKLKDGERIATESECKAANKPMLGVVWAIGPGGKWRAAYTKATSRENLMVKYW